MAIQSRAPVILLTRPADQSERFAQELRHQFPECPIITSPLLTPVFLAPEIPARDWGAVIFTSQTAVDAVKRNAAYAKWLPKRAFCVGDRTAKAAEAAGFQTLSANGTAEELAVMILAENPAGPLLYLRGRDTRGTLVETLISAGIETFSATVYAQEEGPLSDEALSALCGDALVIAPIFSPRTGQILTRQITELDCDLTLCLITISAAVGGFAGAEVIVADRPTAASMVHAVASKLRSLAKA